MDPQKLSQLDPKLREAYQRVMGTDVSVPQSPPPSNVPASSPTPDPTPIPEPSTPAPTINPTITPDEPPQPAITPEPQQPQVAPTNFDKLNSEVSSVQSSPNFSVPQVQAQTIAIKKKNHLMPILFVFVSLIFLAVYTFFWTKIFNFKIPFLP